jgi:hypothetical protein
MLGWDGTKHSTTTNKKSNANVTTNCTLVIHIQCVIKGLSFLFFTIFIPKKKENFIKLIIEKQKFPKISQFFG